MDVLRKVACSWFSRRGSAPRDSPSEPTTKQPFGLSRGALPLRRTGEATVPQERKWFLSWRLSRRLARLPSWIMTARLETHVRASSPVPLPMPEAKPLVVVDAAIEAKVALAREQRKREL